jgi:hypothetical protein
MSLKIHLFQVLGDNNTWYSERRRLRFSDRQRDSMKRNECKERSPQISKTENSFRESRDSLKGNP